MKSAEKTTLLELLDPSALFWSKASYKTVADAFHPFHRHHLNVIAHAFTTTLGVWGAIQLGMDYNEITVYIYAALILLTTPMLTALLHTLTVYGLVKLSPSLFTALAIGGTEYNFTEKQICWAAIAIGFSLQELSHWLCCEKTYMASYIHAQPWMTIIHSIWLLPLVIDSVLMRDCFLSFVPSRNTLVVTKAASQDAVSLLRQWISKNVPNTAETTHLWPHENKGTDGPVTALEQDSGILAGFRKVFDSVHYDILSVVPMNEIYVTAVGSKKEMNSDAVFYTPHTDGPYWWLPGASLYRVLVGVTHNSMVRTRFNLQHDSLDTVVDQGDVLGFDYNRELHWIDHVPGETNEERRSLIKLHYIVYPKGWHRYGKLCAHLNSTYNTWARGNFLKTLRPKSISDHVLAWWIWLTTWFNAVWEEHFGWQNLAYVLGSYLLSVAVGEPRVFVVLTSFRHYTTYITTFKYREPAVAHGYLMRDAKLYKTISMMHLARTMLPLVDWTDSTHVMALGISLFGFGTTLLATWRLGMVRTYFGCELGFVEPCWIEGFPYGVIPHPMIMGQIFSFSIILAALWSELSAWEAGLGIAHISCYTAHMLQEIVTGGY